MADEIIIETTSQEVIEVRVVGPQGPAGSAGAAGPANTLSIGTVTSGATAAATITGAAPSQTLSLVLPKGDKGDTGAQGPAGAGIATLTTKGDTLYRGDTTGERLPIGTTGQVLKVSSSGIPEWGAASGVSSWNDLTDKPSIPTASSDTPSALGVAVAGTSANFARADHVHAMPSAADVGAAAATHATSHAVGAKAEYRVQVAGMTENVVIRANNVGTAGNSITLTFDGTDDIATVLSAWNSANPSNQATLISGDELQIPDNGEEITLSGGMAAGSDPISNPIFNSVGIEGSPVGSLRKFHQFGGKFTVESESGGFGQFQVVNPISGEVSFVFAASATAEEDGSVTSTDNNKVWAFGSGTFGNSPDIFTVGNVGSGSSVFHIKAPTGYVGLGPSNNDPTEALDVDGNISMRDLNNDVAATFVAQGNLTDNRSYDLPDRSGELMLVGDAPASHTHGNLTNDGKVGADSGRVLVTTTAGAVTTLALGTANQVLRVNSGATGVEFADPAAAGVTSVTGTAPIVSSGGTTPTISITTGTTAGTVAAGDDSRITGAAQKSANLSDLSSASTARTNLGLGTAATAATGDFAAASHTHTASAISDSTTAGRALLTAADAAAQRTLLGLAAIATSGSASDLGSGTVPIGRLGASGTPSGSTYLAGDNSWKSVTGGVSAMQSIAINFVLN